MRLTGDEAPEVIRERLTLAASAIYGPEHLAALESQIEHLSHRLAGVAQQELDLTDYPLPNPARRDRSRL